MVTKHAKYLLFNKYIMMHLHSYSVRLTLYLRVVLWSFGVSPLLVPVYGIWLSTVNSPCSIVQKTTVSFHYIHTMICSSHTYISMWWCIVHVNVIFFVLLTYWKMFYYYYLFTISSCAMCLWCVTYHTLTIQCNQSHGALAS